MPGKHRIDRLNSVLQAEISDIIRNEMKDPGLGFVSVTRVRATGDLRHARVNVSVLGDEAAKQATMKALGRASAFIRENLLRRLDVRRVPQLDFLLDENIEYSIHISEVLDKLKEERSEEDQ